MNNTQAVAYTAPTNSSWRTSVGINFPTIVANAFTSTQAWLMPAYANDNKERSKPSNRS